MANENVSINIDSKADLRGFKQAESAASKLNKTVKGLAATLGIAYGARAVTNFGKAAVKAFTDDQKSATKLAVAVKNLGLAFEQANVEGFISSLEKSASIADDLLRPAFQTLLTTTGDFAKSQELLKTAVNVSRGSGEELITVAKDLSQAYIGNTRSLRKYYLGLSQTQLKEMSFLQIQDKLNKQFKGASAAYLATYAGKMEALNTAAGNAQETIGGALVDALINVSGAGDIEGVVKKIDGLAAAGVKAIDTMDILAQSLYFSIFEQSPAEFFGFTDSGIKRFEKLIEDQKRAQQYAGAAPFNPKDNAITGYKASEAAADKARRDAAKNAKALAAAQAKQTAELKKQAALKKAGTVFDMEQIQLIAALKGQLTTDEQNRVKALIALNADNAAAATYYTDLVVKAQDKTGALAEFLRKLPDARNPFAYLDDWLKNFQSKVNNITTGGGYVGTTYVSPAQVAANLAVGATLADLEKTASPWLFGGQSAESTKPVLPSTNAMGGSFQGYGTNFRRAEEQSNLTGPIQVSVNIDGKEITSVVQNQALNGNSATINRAQGNFG